MLPGHDVPQAPQLCESVVMSTHALLQAVNPVSHAAEQVPFWQTPLPAFASPPQVFPQDPQLFGSVFVFTHVPLQNVPVQV